MPLSFPNYRVTSILKNPHVPLGPWRAPSHSQNVFFIESFIDEMADATGKDPAALRRELLAHRSDMGGHHVSVPVEILRCGSISNHGSRC
jgi:CO/xanthine dehydrogenase Mo-binding subunit